MRGGIQLKKVTDTEIAKTIQTLKATAELLENQKVQETSDYRGLVAMLQDSDVGTQLLNQLVAKRLEQLLQNNEVIFKITDEVKHRTFKGSHPALEKSLPEVRRIITLFVTEKRKVKFTYKEIEGFARYANTNLSLGNFGRGLRQLSEDGLLERETVGRKVVFMIPETTFRGILDGIREF